MERLRGSASASAPPRRRRRVRVWDWAHNSLLLFSFAFFGFQAGASWVWGGSASAPRLDDAACMQLEVSWFLGVLLPPFLLFAYRAVPRHRRALMLAMYAPLAAVLIAAARAERVPSHRNCRLPFELDVLVLPLLLLAAALVLAVGLRAGTVRLPLPAPRTAAFQSSRSTLRFLFVALLGTLLTIVKRYTSLQARMPLLACELAFFALAAQGLVIVPHFSATTELRETDKLSQWTARLSVVVVFLTFGFVVGCHVCYIASSAPVMTFDVCLTTQIVAAVYFYGGVVAMCVRAVLIAPDLRWLPALLLVPIVAISLWSILTSTEVEDNLERIVCNTKDNIAVLSALINVIGIVYVTRETHRRIGLMTPRARPLLLFSISNAFTMVLMALAVVVNEQTNIPSPVIFVSFLSADFALFVVAVSSAVAFRAHVPATSAVHTRHSSSSVLPTVGP